MTAEVFTRFFAGRYEVPKQVTLLFGIAKNVVSDYFRELPRKERAEEQAAFSGGDPGTATDPVQRAEEDRILHEALWRLPAGERAVVVMRIMHGKDWHYICDCLGISLSAALGRYKRAMAKLRKGAAARRIRG